MKNPDSSAFSAACGCGLFASCPNCCPDDLTTEKVASRARVTRPGTRRRLRGHLAVAVAGISRRMQVTAWTVQ